MMTLDEKLRELIAVGASVTANCQPCLQYHATKAREAGATSEEISEAVAVGKTVRKGAAAKLDKFAADLTRDAPAAPDARDDGCGCGSPPLPTP